MTVRLTEIRRGLLAMAASRDDRCLEPPERLRGAAAEKVARGLLEAGLALEVKATGALPVWRRDGMWGPAFALIATEAGMAVGSGEGPARTEQPRGIAALHEDAGVSRRPSWDAIAVGRDEQKTGPRPGTKLAAIVALMRRREGADLGEIVAATGWRAPTARAALTGLRKRGLRILLDRSDPLRRPLYRAELESKTPDLNERRPAADTPLSGDEQRRSGAAKQLSQEVRR